MAGTRSDVTSDVNEAMHAREGTRFCHCVEMTFGQAIRARPGDATKPDTEVIWTGRGDLTKLHVYTSVDDGLTWQRVGRSGDPIPKLAVDPATGLYAVAYADTTNRRVQGRLIFEDGAACVVDSFTMRATFEDATVAERVETAANGKLAEGTLVGCTVDAGVGGLLTRPDVALRFLGNRGAATHSVVHGGDSSKAGLHLSHGDYQATIEGNVIEWQADTATRKADAAMAVEGWFRTEKTTGVLFGWRTNPARLTWGLTLELIEDTAETAHLRFRTREWVNSRAPLVGIQAWQIDSPAGSVDLNRWHHFAWSYDGFWGSFYLDGQLYARVPFKAAINGVTVRKGVFTPFGIVMPTNAGFVMGRHPVDAENVGSTASSFLGRMVEWRLYTKPVSAGTILRRRFRKLDPAEVAVMVAQDGLQAYYRDDQGFGTACLDFTGHDLHLVWDQQQVGGGRLPPQLAWLPSAQHWRGYPTGSKEVLPGVVESRDRSPGRQTPTLSLDSDGDVLRVTDAPFDVTFDGKTFTGVGSCGGIETIQEAGDLAPTSVTLTLSGVAPQNISLALSARYLDRPCRIWQVTWADDGEQLDPFLVFDGRLDELDPALGKTGTVRVSAESHLRNWRRPKHRRWNDESQRAIWPHDHGLEFLAAMVDREVWWPVRVQDVKSAGFVVVSLAAGLAAAGWLAAWGLW